MLINKRTQKEQFVETKMASEPDVTHPLNSSVWIKWGGVQQ
jgi:hypothetical protein